MAVSDSHPVSIDRAAEARTRILEAALKEFSAHGLAGARTEAIAATAGVNKALLYYYFAGKETLYAAALELAAERVRNSSLAALGSDVTAGERLLRMALSHFDRILAQREFQSLMQQEMIRAQKGEPGNLLMLVERIFRPLHLRFQEVAREGMASGELIEADWMQMELVALGANVFYFLTAPLSRLMTGGEPFSEEALTRRRRAIVEFLGQAVFVDRKSGAAAAARVLAHSPMPELNGEFVFWGKDEREK